MRKLYTIFFIIFAICMITVIAMNQGDTQTVATCRDEDGSTQDVCVWHYSTPKGESRTLVNHNYGEWTYYPHTGLSITWDSAPTSIDVLNAAK